MDKALPRCAGGTSATAAGDLSFSGRGRIAGARWNLYLPRLERYAQVLGNPALHQLVLGQRNAVLSVVHNPRDFAIFVVGDPENGKFYNRVMFVGSGFDFGATDILTASNDDIFLTVDDKQIAVFVEITDVTKRHPVVALRMALVVVGAFDRQVGIGNISADNASLDANLMTTYLAERLDMALPELGPDFYAFMSNLTPVEQKNDAAT